MKKILLSAACLLGLSAYAQEKATKQYGFWDNWFLQAQVGANYTKAENSTKDRFFDMLTPKVQIGVGKFFSPYVGVRLSGGGWQSKYYHLPEPGHTRQNYVEGNLDGLFNLTNIFAPRRDESRFNLFLIGGINYTHRVKNAGLGVGTNDFFSPRAGLMADVRLSEALSLNLEVASNLLSDEFNGRVVGSKYDYNMSALLGLTYRLPQRGFEQVVIGGEMIDNGEIARLNKEINDRQREIYRQKNQIANLNTNVANLRKQLEEKPTTEKKVVTNQETILNAVVVFKLGSAQLEDNQTINIYNAAKYLQENPSVNVVVTGYADKATGTEAVNQRLSEQRAKAVADILTNRYGIASSRITTEASGDRVQPFTVNEWNRVVVFTIR